MRPLNVEYSWASCTTSIWSSHVIDLVDCGSLPMLVWIELVDCHGTRIRTQITINIIVWRWQHVSTREIDQSYVNQQHLHGFLGQLFAIHMADVWSIQRLPLVGLIRCRLCDQTMATSWNNMLNLDNMDFLVNRANCDTSTKVGINILIMNAYLNLRLNIFNGMQTWHQTKAVNHHFYKCLSMCIGQATCSRVNAKLLQCIMFLEENAISKCLHFLIDCRCEYVLDAKRLTRTP